MYYPNVPANCHYPEECEYPCRACLEEAGLQPVLGYSPGTTAAAPKRWSLLQPGEVVSVEPVSIPTLKLTPGKITTPD